MSRAYLTVGAMVFGGAVFALGCGDDRPAAECMPACVGTTCCAEDESCVQESCCPVGNVCDLDAYDATAAECCEPYIEACTVDGCCPQAQACFNTIIGFMECCDPYIGESCYFDGTNQYCTD